MNVGKLMDDAQYEKVILKVGGMMCATCVSVVESALKNLDGITNINVNLNAEKAYVTYNPSVVSISDMKRAIESAGYQYLGLEGENEELEEIERTKDIKNKFYRIIVGFAFGIPLMVLMLLSIHINPLILLLITIIPFIYISYPIFIAGYRALKNKTLSMDVMYSMGIGVSFLSSLLGTFGILSPDFIFYDTALLLASFLTLGRYLEARAKGRTSESIKKLIGLQPKTATVLKENNEEVQLPIEDVKIDDIILIKPGERIPVDGMVLDGESYVDESMISGEPIPVFKKKNDIVIGGTVNKNGVLRVKAQKIGKDTVLAQIINLVEEAQGSKPSIQRIADIAVGYFIPAVLTVALLSFMIWYLVIGESVLFALTTFISVIVVACPCALGLATPTATSVGLGKGAELGILIRDSNVLEKFGKLTSVVFDKTGTLTRGKPEVTDIITDDIDEEEFLKFVGSLEKNSEHPISEAIMKRVKETYDYSQFNTIEGKGIEGVINGTKVVIGNEALFIDKKIPFDHFKDTFSRLENEGKTIMLVSLDNKTKGIIAVADTLRDDAKTTIKNLYNMGLKIYIITGDNRTTAKAIAKELDIENSNVFAEVLPNTKSEKIKELQEKGEVVAFVGDGINDAPALAEADIGIAIGGGTDIAIESGDIVLVNNRLLDVVSAIQLGRKVMSRIKQNMFWAFAYNTALIPLAAGLFYPYTISPEIGAFAMALSSITVVSLSLMLKRFKPEINQYNNTKKYKPNAMETGF